MRTAIAGDHEGYRLKSQLIEYLEAQRHEVLNLGTHSCNPVDYPDYAQAVAEQLNAGHCERGILICGSGVGICVAANKIRGIRAGICHDTLSAHQGVEHDDLNVIVLGAWVVGDRLAEELVGGFLRARFSGEERHRRRLQKIDELEAKQQKRASA